MHLIMGGLSSKKVQNQVSASLYTSFLLESEEKVKKKVTNVWKTAGYLDSFSSETDTSLEDSPWFTDNRFFLLPAHLFLMIRRPNNISNHLNSL